jgi:galactokinase/mevalonate kinase-like predicted kinase
MSKMGRQRIVESSAPGRAGIVGNPSDIYGGSVVSCAVPRRATCRIGGLCSEDATDGAAVVVHLGNAVWSARRGETLALRGDSFDLVRSVLGDLGLPVEPCRVTLETTVPFGAGLSGSTALMVALVTALVAWRGEPIPNPYRLAETVRRIEYECLGITCGFQDAYMTVFGGLHYCDFRGKTFAAAGDHFGTMETLAGGVPSGDPALPLVIAHTDVTRVSGSVHRPLTQRWLDGEAQVIAAYERVAALARLGKRALLVGDWQTLGALMNENHALQRDLGGSGPENEALIGAALAAGAWGAKLAGAGAGGTIIALHPEPAQLVDRLRAQGVREILAPDPATPGVTWRERWTGSG